MQITKESAIKLLNGAEDLDLTVEVLREFMSFLTTNKLLGRLLVADYFSRPDVAELYLEEMADEDNLTEMVKQTLDTTGVGFSNTSLMELISIARYFNYPENQGRLDEIVKESSTMIEALKKCKADMMVTTKGVPLVETSFEEEKLKILVAEAESLAVYTTIVPEDDMVIVKAGFDKKIFEFGIKSEGQFSHYLAERIKEARKNFLRQNNLESCMEFLMSPSALVGMADGKDADASSQIFWMTYFNIYAAIFAHLGGNLKERGPLNGFTLTVWREDAKNAVWELNYDYDGLTKFYWVILSLVLIEAHSVGKFNNEFLHRKHFRKALETFRAILTAGHMTCSYGDIWLHVKHEKWFDKNDYLSYPAIELMAVRYDVEDLFKLLCQATEDTKIGSKLTPAIGKEDCLTIEDWHHVLDFV